MCYKHHNNTVHYNSASIDAVKEKRIEGEVKAMKDRLELV
jgi:hypothetical protein